MDIQSGVFSNTDGTIESVGNLSIKTNNRLFANYYSGAYAAADGSPKIGGRGISSGGNIFLLTGTFENYAATIQAAGSINITTNLYNAINAGNTASIHPSLGFGGQGIVSGTHLGFYNIPNRTFINEDGEEETGPGIYNNNGLLQSQTFSLNGLTDGSPRISKSYFDGRLTLTGVAHQVEGPVNVFRDPFDQKYLVLNGLSNAFSDYLDLDAGSGGFFAAANPDFPLGERVLGGVVAVSTSANIVLEGLGAGSAIRWTGGQLLKTAPKITRFGGRYVSFEAFNGVKSTVKNRINPSNYEFKLNSGVLGSGAGGFEITFEGGGKWFKNAPQSLKTAAGSPDSALGMVVEKAASAAERTKIINSFERLNSTHPQMSADPSILTAFNKVSGNANIPADKLDKIVDSLATAGARCRTCASPGNSEVRFADEVLEDLNRFATEFGNTPGYNSFLTELGRQSTTAIGGSWTLEAVMRNRTRYFRNEVITGFEISHVPGRDFAADMVTTRGGINVYYEFKNWGSTQLSGTTFANQMTGTLSVVNNLNEIKYVFNPSRWVPTTSQMRNYLTIGAS